MGEEDEGGRKEEGRRGDSVGRRMHCMATMSGKVPTCVRGCVERLRACNKREKRLGLEKFYKAN